MERRAVGLVEQRYTLSLRRGGRVGGRRRRLDRDVRVAPELSPDSRMRGAASRCARGGRQIGYESIDAFRISSFEIQISSFEIQISSFVIQHSSFLNTKSDTVISARHPCD